MTSILYAIDPASHRTGVARFEDGRLESAGLLKANAKDSYQKRVFDLSVQMRVFVRSGRLGSVVPSAPSGVCEMPQIYRKGPGSKVDPEDVMKIYGVGVALMVVLMEAGTPADSIRTFHPHDWKGNAEKFTRADDGTKIYSAWTRMSRVLTPHEKKILDASGFAMDDNTLDAVGVGLRALARM